LKLSHDSDYILYPSERGLELRHRHNNKIGAVYADFLTGKAQHRRLYGGGKGQQIAKAIGLKKIDKPNVLDLTAGLGRDAFVLASLGCQLTLLERSPTIHALLADALQRASQSQNSEVLVIIARMQLHQSDAFAYLDKLITANLDENKPDVIYLDPMFPERTKTAAIKKEMLFFHDIVGTDADSDQLLDLARQCAKKRVVVKRPRLAKPLNQVPANFVIKGKSTRYDVYLPYTT
jgi:16S rRNA (guanine1516-N2)-methyltransferase